VLRWGHHTTDDHRREEETLGETHTSKEVIKKKYVRDAVARPRGGQGSTYEPKEGGTIGRGEPPPTPGNRGSLRKGRNSLEEETPGRVWGGWGGGGGGVSFGEGMS